MTIQGVPVDRLSEPSLSSVSLPFPTGGRMRYLAGLARSFSSARTSLGAVLQTSAANILIQAAYICSGVITARALGPSGRGSLAAIIMWPQFLSYLLTLGVPISCVYHIRKEPRNASSLTAVAITVSVAMGLLASLIGFVIIPYPLRTYSHEIIRFARQVIIAAPLALLALTLSSLAQSAGAYRRYNFMRVAQPLAVLSVLLVAWLAHGLSPYSAALAYLFAGTPIILWNLVWVWRHFHPSFAGGKQAIRDLTSYGVRVWGADLLGTVSNQIDRVLVVSMLSPREMGLYVVSQSVAALIGVLPAAMCTVLITRAAGRSLQEVVDLTGRAVRVTIAGLLCVAIPLFLIGGLLLTLVYGHKYDGAAAILRILLGEAVLDGATGILSLAFLAAGIPGTVTLLQGTGLLTAFPLMYFMIPRWGLVGAAYALLISTAIRFTFILANYPLRFKMRPPGLILRSSDLELLRRAK
jgi:O-antigen/teichoic acid export membrane protein